MGNNIDRRVPSVGVRMVGMTTVAVPHFKFPFVIDGTSFAVREQDTTGEIQDCVTVLILTPVDSRMVLPDYGTDELLYSQAPANIAAILAVCTKWEPRAAVTITETLNTLNEKIATLNMQITGGTP
jgi:phage baseplate assembly protein W